METSAVGTEEPRGLVRTYRGWWAAIAAVSFVVGLFTSGGIAGALGFTFGAFLFPGFLTGLAWAFWRLARRPLSTSQAFSTFVVAWLIVMALVLVGAAA